MLREKLKIENLDFYYNKSQGKKTLKDISFSIFEHQVTALIGPSGCGKTTFLKTINRMNDLIENIKVQGQIYMDGENILSKDVNVVALRRKVGMVFQRANPFPKSIFDNVAYGPRIFGQKKKKKLQEIVEHALKELRFGKKSRII